MTFGAVIQPPEFTFGNKLVISGTIDPKPYLTGVFMCCQDPKGNAVLAEIRDIDADQTVFNFIEVLGNPISPWISGTYAVTLYWNPVNGPATPEKVTLTFEYES